MKIYYTDTPLPYEDGLDALLGRLDGEKGMYMASDTDYPGRYSRWGLGFAAPPVEIVGTANETVFTALNDRGEKLLEIISSVFAHAPCADFTVVRADEKNLRCVLTKNARVFAEEERSLQPSPLSPVRALVKAQENADGFAGFYGAFKYDLLFCFSPIMQKHSRADDPSLFRLFLPDSLYILDRRKETAYRRDYEFSWQDIGTAGMARPAAAPPAPQQTPVRETPAIDSDMTDDAYAAMVEKAGAHIRKGDVFEVVLSRTFRAPVSALPSALFGNIRAVNPSPYEFLLQMGAEQLIGASPEMFVRVEGRRVESCPISGTARRSSRAGEAAVLEDAEILRALLNSKKDEAELTMCTDVDRNDKARVCEAGSVRVIARRQIETYTGLFHTVDHVEGTLREGYDGIDAFLSHMWAVTLTGAPKGWAAQIIEDFEPAPRGYYGAAVGALHFNGNVNTGITIRTLHVKDGMAAYRAGASIVYDSVPAEEAAETHTKAASFKRILSGKGKEQTPRTGEKTGLGKTVVLIDNDDSFVNTLADYIRQTGACAKTYRHGTPLETLLAHKPHLVVHSPGPGLPAQFGVPATVRTLAKLGVPQFGVCLGLQGMFEAFGGTLGYLQHPHHGKTWNITHDGHALFEGVQSPCAVGAYHSIYGTKDTLPADLEALACNENGVIMALAHRTLPLWAVQFHPESVLSMQDHAGHKMIENVMRHLAAPAP